MNATTSSDWGSRFLTALTHHAANAPKPVIRVAATLKPVPPAASGSIITAALLARLGGHDPVTWAPVLSDACTSHGIDTSSRVAMFLAQVFTETGSLSSVSESLNYTAASLLREWPSHFTVASAQRLGRTSSHPADQRGIANTAYGGRNGNTKPNDGWNLRGGGCLETTGRGNYVALGKIIAWTGTVEELADYVRTTVGAAVSAAVFWQAHALNGPADRRDVETCRRIINGGTNGLADCKLHYADACTALGIH